MSSGTPYIGSKISLVSKAEIRYEGFLYTIDQNDSTVTLAKVISLGTEDRVPGAGAVPAREEVFEYIVFRGSDIKDLHVCEGPKKVEDPAIVTHSYSQSYNPNYHRGPPAFPTGGMPNFGYNPFNIPQNVPVDIPHQSSRQQTPPNLPRNDRGSQNRNQSGSFQDSRSKARGNEGSKYKDEGYTRDNRDGSSSKLNNKESRNTRDYETRDNSRDERNSGRDARNRDGRDNRSRGGNRADKNERRDQRGDREDKAFYDKEIIDSKASSDMADTKRYRDSRDNRYRDNRNTREYKSNRYVRRDEREDNRDDQQRSGSEGSRGQPRGRGRGGGRPNNRRGMPHGSGGNARNKFTEEFDFETANAKFDKKEIEMELLKVLKKVKIKDEENGSAELKDIEEREVDETDPLPSPDKFYDKSKSFFDSILCEAMVPKTEDEVMTRRQEQALNAETFGSSAAHYRPGYRGRGRGRGRWRGQGRGYYRGRGNFRGNSNRRWVDYEFDYEAAGIKNKQQPPPKVSSDD